MEQSSYTAHICGINFFGDDQHCTRPPCSDGKRRFLVLGISDAFRRGAIDQHRIKRPVGWGDPDRFTMIGGALVTTPGMAGSRYRGYGSDSGAASAGHWPDAV